MTTQNLLSIGKRCINGVLPQRGPVFRTLSAHLRICQLHAQVNVVMTLSPVNERREWHCGVFLQLAFKQKPDGADNEWIATFLTDREGYKRHPEDSANVRARFL